MHILKKNLANSIKAKTQLLEDPKFLEAFDKAVHWISDAFIKGARVYIAGNGGSAADAQHLAAEFVSRLARERDPLPAEALTTDSSIITAIGNDYGFEQIFTRQLMAKMDDVESVFIAISTSGNSKNIISALNYLSSNHCYKTILLTGNDGGEAKKIANLVLCVPGESTSGIQEVHEVVFHSLCEAVEEALFPR